MHVSTLPELVLASASPRRRDLLARLGLPFSVFPTDVDETPQAGELPEAYVLRLARAKAACCRVEHPRSLILAADTAVALPADPSPALLGKPGGPDEARAMLVQLSGREHQVLTALALLPPEGESTTHVSTTTVTFAAIPPDLLTWYLSTDDPYDKAGAYGIQSKAALFISRIDGSWTNVVGLPLEALPRLFRSTGHPIENYLSPARPS